METVYEDACDIVGTPLMDGDHAVVVKVPHTTSNDWIGHIVSIEKLVRWEKTGAWAASIRMLYANPGSTWGLAPDHLQRIDKNSAEYAMAEAVDRQHHANTLQSGAENLAAKAREEMFQAQQCWTRAAQIKAMG